MFSLFLAWISYRYHWVMGPVDSITDAPIIASSSGCLWSQFHGLLFIWPGHLSAGGGESHLFSEGVQTPYESSTATDVTICIVYTSWSISIENAPFSSIYPFTTSLYVKNSSCYSPYMSIPFINPWTYASSNSILPTVMILQGVLAIKVTPNLHIWVLNKVSIYQIIKPNAASNSFPDKVYFTCLLVSGWGVTDSS